jgi:hypothetical protein
MISPAESSRIHKLFGFDLEFYRQCKASGTPFFHPNGKFALTKDEWREAQRAWHADPQLTADDITPWVDKWRRPFDSRDPSTLLNLGVLMSELVFARAARPGFMRNLMESMAMHTVPEFTATELRIINRIKRKHAVSKTAVRQMIQRERV